MGEEKKIDMVRANGLGTKEFGVKWLRISEKVINFLAENGISVEDNSDIIASTVYATMRAIQLHESSL